MDGVAQCRITELRGDRRLAHHRDRKARRQAQQNDRVAEIKVELVGHHWGHDVVE